MIHQHPRKRPGIALVLVLLVLATLTTLAMGLAYRTRIELELASSSARQLQAYYLALGGLERGMAFLDGPGISGEASDPMPQLIADAEEEALFSRVSRAHALSKAKLSYHFKSEQAGLNLVHGRDDVLERALGRVLTSQIFDWQDSDDHPQGLGGAESDRYGQRNPPYVAKNQAITHLRELLFLEDVNYETYLGEDLNMNGRLDGNERDGDLSPPRDNGDSHLDQGLIHLLTVLGDGKVNLNTASQAILTALPGMDSASAARIIAYRCGRDGRPGTEDDTRLGGHLDLADITGLSGLQLRLLREQGCFDSQYARLFARARWGEFTFCGLSATADLSGGRPVLTDLERLY